MYLIQHFDPQFNLLYYFVAPVQEEKSGILSRLGSAASAKASGYSNIVIWDIPKKRKFNIFQEKELAANEFVSNLLFEIAYDPSKRQRIFNENTYILNNNPLSERQAVNKMIIATHNQENKQTTLWFCDKWGFDKFRMATFSDSANWHLDVQNGEIRIVEATHNDIKVLELRWYL